MTGRAVCTPHLSATEAGARAFAAGGNAVDAALAAAAVLTVVYPHNCALGGDLFALVRDPDGGVVSINASGPAPARTSADDLRRRHARMPVTGPDAVTVPGLVAGWAALHDHGAALRWAAALEEARALAADGAPVSRSLDAAIKRIDLSDPGMAAVLAPGGTRLARGDRLRQPALAATLEALAGEGPRAFYDGDVGERLVAGLAARGVPLQPSDLQGYAPEVGAPVRATALGLDVLTCPPNSAGVLVAQALLALEATGVADPLGADAGTLAGVFRGTAADRDRMLGDPRRGAVGAEAFLAPERIAAIAEAALAGAAPGPVAPVPPASGDTIAVVASDAEGRAVSLIQSLFNGFGALILEPETGVLVQNRGACFTLEAGHPNEFAPGARPAHTLSPLLIERDGGLLGVLGTMGGRAQSQILTQVLLRVLEGASPQDAVDAPRWLLGATSTADTDVNRAEGTVEDAVREAVERAAGEFVELADGSERVGHAHAIWMDPFRAGSDRRADGGAWAG